MLARPSSRRRRVARPAGVATALAALAAAALVVTGCSGSAGGSGGSDAAQSQAVALSTPDSSRAPLTSAAPRTSATKPKPSTSTAKPKPKPHRKPTPAKRTSSHPKPTHIAPRAPGPSTTTHPARPITISGTSIYAIGDSVMVDAQSNLQSTIRGIHVDADVSRQTGTGIGILQSQRASGTVARTTVFGLGTNGQFTPDQINQVINLTAGHNLIIITSHCPYCSWTSTNNANVHQLCTVARHCYIADFQAEANQHPEWFGGDGVHMAIGGTGAQAYAQVVANTYASIPAGKR